MKKLFVLVVGVMLVMGFAMNASAGEYYMFSQFSISGYDVDSYYVNDTTTLIYINVGDRVNVYTATLHDTDGDGIIEPNQHPNNIGPDGIPGNADDHIGPIEQRTIAQTGSYSIPAIGYISTSEIYAAADRIYFCDDNESVSEYIFASGTVNQVTNSMGNISHLGRASDGTWFGANESRTVYSYDGNNWNYEFTWADMAGSHGDGMEVWAVEVSPGVYEDHVFVSDMTSAHIAEWALVGGVWTEIERYDYAGFPGYLEGMGAGGFGGHIWFTSGNSLHEIGGGALPPEPDVPEPGLMLLLGTGLVGLVGFSRKFKK